MMVQEIWDSAKVEDLLQDAEPARFSVYSVPASSYYVDLFKTSDGRWLVVVDYGYDRSAYLADGDADLWAAGQAVVSSWATEFLETEEGRAAACDFRRAFAEALLDLGVTADAAVSC